MNCKIPNISISNLNYYQYEKDHGGKCVHVREIFALLCFYFTSLYVI